MNLTKQDIDYYRNKITSERHITKLQWNITKAFLSNKSKSIKDLAKKFNIKVVHFDSAILEATWNTRKILEKDGYNKEEIWKILKRVFGS